MIYPGECSMCWWGEWVFCSCWIKHSVNVCKVYLLYSVVQLACFFVDFSASLICPLKKVGCWSPQLLLYWHLSLHLDLIKLASYFWVVSCGWIYICNYCIFFLKCSFYQYIITFFASFYNFLFKIALADMIRATPSCSCFSFVYLFSNPLLSVYMHLPSEVSFLNEAYSWTLFFN